MLRTRRGVRLGRKSFKRRPQPRRSRPIAAKKRLKRFGMGEIEPAAPGEQEFARRRTHGIIERHLRAPLSQNLGRHQPGGACADNGDFRRFSSAVGCGWFSHCPSCCAKKFGPARGLRGRRKGAGDLLEKAAAVRGNRRNPVTDATHFGVALRPRSCVHLTRALCRKAAARMPRSKGAGLAQGGGL